MLLAKWAQKQLNLKYLNYYLSLDVCASFHLSFCLSAKKTFLMDKHIKKIQFNYLTIENSISALQGCVFLGWIGKIRKDSLEKLNISQQLSLCGLTRLRPVSFAKILRNSVLINQLMFLSQTAYLSKLLSRNASRNRAWPRSRDSISHHLFMGGYYN